MKKANLIFRKDAIKDAVTRLILCASIATVVPLLAHHSFSAEFDGTKPIELKGIVTKVEWANPHVYFYVDVKDEKGPDRQLGL